MVKTMRVLAVVLIMLLAACNRGDKNAWAWDMDPRLASMAEWAYDCMLDVTDLEPSVLPVPNVLGVDEPWGNGAVGTFYRSSRHIKVQITRPETHVVDIMLHEMGHDGDYRVNGKYTGEDYANWVNNQCRESVRPDIYPAPLIDWEAE